MKESVDFSYDGILSTDMGLINVKVDSSGLFDEKFLSDRAIQEVAIRGNDKPYFQGVKRSPLSISLSFAFTNKFDEAKIRDVARWLDADYYKPLFTLDNPTRIYYCVLNSGSNFLHNGIRQGYLTLEMRCDSPYSYSPTYVSNLYDYSANVVGGTSLVFTNDGDVTCQPELWITKVGNGDVSITNNTNGGSEFKFTGLLNTETVYVDCDNEQIVTDLSNAYRYDNFNDNYLELVRGVNNLVVIGNCKVQFRYRFKTLQG
jgi:phage-related protein